MSEELKQAALDYHRYPRPGKLEIRATKPLDNQYDLALAYSPGVAAACESIEQDSTKAADYTARGNLVAVITNGTAVLGLGAIGSLASKPVMEGKAVLFKQFANVDVFDIEVDERDPQRFIDTVASLEPTFGGINLEDIKAPECFIIEEGLKARMNIPVFHDDQHGTAIVVGAAILNGLHIVGKNIDEVKLVASGAGAAAQACLRLLIDLGLKPENIIVCDGAGVIYTGRTARMDSYKQFFAVDTEDRTLEQALVGADIFLGLSAAGVLDASWLKTMQRAPIILALANPTPEVMPEEAKAVRPDAIIATGRSDYPNQVNNVLCFPFLFRGALDVGATEINSEMKMACVHAIAEIARAEPSDILRSAYGGDELQFGPNYLIPKPFDKRLLEMVPIAVAQAAMDTGVAQRPLADIEAYKEQLNHQVFKTGMIMKPVFEQAQKQCAQVVFAEGEDERVLQAAQQSINEGIAKPILIGRREVVELKLAELGLSMKVGNEFQLLDPNNYPCEELYGKICYQRLKRLGYSPQEATQYLRSNHTVLAAAMVASGDADAMICGTIGRYGHHLRNVEEMIGMQEGVGKLAALNVLVSDSGTLFMTDTFVQENPGAEELVEITRMGAEEVRLFGLEPKVALLSHSNFGSHNSVSAIKMRQATELVRNQLPELEVEGEMSPDLALNEALRSARFPGSRLGGEANLLVMPNQDSANIAFTLLKTLVYGIAIGPILMGAAKSVHVVTPSITVRGLLNMTALAVVRSINNQ